MIKVYLECFFKIQYDKKAIVNENAEWPETKLNSLLSINILIVEFTEESLIGRKRWMVFFIKNTTANENNALKIVNTPTNKAFLKPKFL